MTGNVQLYLAEAGRALTRMAGRLVGFGVAVKAPSIQLKAMFGSTPHIFDITVKSLPSLPAPRQHFKFAWQTVNPESWLEESNTSFRRCC